MDIPTGFAQAVRPTQIDIVKRKHIQSRETGRLRTNREKRKLEPRSFQVVPFQLRAYQS